MFQEISNVDALKLMKAEATKLGITFSPNIGLNTLEAKLEEFKLEEAKKAEKNKDKPKETAFSSKARLAALKLEAYNSEDLLNKSLTKMQIKSKTMNKASKLVRCSVTCLDPSKKDMPGAILGVRNSIIPLTKKFVPYDGRVTHLPSILVNHLMEKKCQIFKIITNSRTGEKERKPVSSNMFSVNILPHLNSDEMEELAEAQRAAGTIEDIVA